MYIQYMNAHMHSQQEPREVSSGSCSASTVVRGTSKRPVPQCFALKFDWSNRLVRVLYVG